MLSMTQHCNQLVNECVRTFQMSLNHNSFVVKILSLMTDLTLERLHFQTTKNDRVCQLMHYVNKLYFVHLFDQGDILKDEISFVAP